jgi:hypothetical protein
MKPYELGPKIVTPDVAKPYRRRIGDLVHRPLRIYTQDPGAATYNAPVVVVRVPWEPLTPGPTGRLFAVEDYNATRNETYAPVDLDSPEVLTGQGLAPSTADPRFAQQMTYAVAMTVFDRFALALGRTPDFTVGPQLQRLTIRPHAAEEDNAWYDSETGALEFGYVFTRSDGGGRSQRGSVVFTSLSHDIVVHETTHALLDGMRPLFLEPTHQDVAAFHEGFSDLVALLLRYQYRDLVERGLEEGLGLGAPLLTQMAKQWGESGGDGKTPLRQVLLRAGKPEDQVDKDDRYGARKEEHDLGAVLVAAVIEAMSRIYERKTKRLRRLADTPHAPRDAALSLLASEAQKLAGEFLSILIRAVDYCPPVDVRFGDYLRAMVTADNITVPEDPWGYREALVWAFRRYGVRVNDVADLSEESLLWKRPEQALPAVPGLAFAELRHEVEPGWPTSVEERVRRGEALGDYIADRRYDCFGLVPPARRRGIDPPVVQSVRTLRRLSPDQDLGFHVVAEVTQRRRLDNGAAFYGGATVIIDECGVPQYVIGKGVQSARREDDMRAFLRAAGPAYRRAAKGERGSRRDLLRHLDRHRGRRRAAD